MAALAALAKILESIGSWPVGAFLLVSLLGPWVLMFLAGRSSERRFTEVSAGQERRFEAVVAMYEKNVALVQSYERLSSEQVDTIRLNTQASTQLCDWLKNRTPCHQLVRGRE